MKVIPETIQKAIDLKKNLFWVPDGDEWELKIEKDTRFIEKHVDTPVLIFANNGYGDYLFLKKGKNGEFDEQIFEYFHEGPTVETVAVELETVFGSKERPPSTDNYPVARYESGESVLMNDKVQYKVWLFFWKGWIDGVVTYVPGISQRQSEHEHSGLKWVEIKGEGETIGSLVDPKTGHLHKVRFVSRAVERHE